MEDGNRMVYEGLSARAWLMTWPHVRQEIEQLLNDYRAYHPVYDPHWTEGLLEELDCDVANLIHRTTWLSEHLTQAHQTN